MPRRCRDGGAKRRVNDLPTGASRLDTPAVGLHGVWVNGVRTVNEHGPVRDCGLPGRVLRDFTDTEASRGPPSPRDAPRNTP